MSNHRLIMIHINSIQYLYWNVQISPKKFLGRSSTSFPTIRVLDVCRLVSRVEWSPLGLHSCVYSDVDNAELIRWTPRSASV